MPPKKRNAATTAKTASKKKANSDEATPAKQVKTEEEEPATKDNIIAKLKAADKNDKKKRIYLPDKHLPGASSYSVREILVEIFEIKNITCSN